MDFETWHQWLPLRLLIVFLATLVGAVALVLIASFPGRRKERQGTGKAAEADAAPTALERASGTDVASVHESVAARAEHTLPTWTGRRNPSDRHAA